MVIDLLCPAAGRHRFRGRSLSSIDIIKNETTSTYMNKADPVRFCAADVQGSISVATELQQFLVSRGIRSIIQPHPGVNLKATAKLRR
jgi:hypothetical protein